jgi:hypothetical protein
MIGYYDKAKSQDGCAWSNANVTAEMYLNDLCARGQATRSKWAY